ncbi:type IV secretory system conjugative DNA transfer family protein [Variovorax sp. J22R115]|uniref:type IV secretory system conjugative DNA transfer family protein n=1 Tax=Variovorax sp. J22R115 TaxID=3053509 RepID=UPI002575CEC5|nr:type IV secretory system conjugative DNA transfer family protein [Variovorax sp. J22R115]MDM0052116.1 type IV secretory system conjugative DNA transfer family protein [Variovorax sp. J22R115]
MAAKAAPVIVVTREIQICKMRIILENRAQRATWRQSPARGDVSRGQSKEQRALMLPQERKAMGPEKEAFLYEGIPHSVMCEKIRCYQDRYFTARLLPKVGVPELAI